MPNSANIDVVINKIYEMQRDADHKYWKDGLFANYRINKLLKYKRPDNSMFFTASIVFTLNNIKEKLSVQSQILVENITKKASKNYEDYRSKTGENIYNFYPTKPSKHFGNGLILNHFKHFQLPHDADDTALVYLVNSFSADENKWLQHKLAEHSNGHSKKISSTFDHYKQLKAYSTWFGKNMSIEFDACVLANILYSQLQAGLLQDQHGLDSWEYLKQTILRSEYLEHPFKVSHNYAKTEIIAYHVSRLIAKYDLPDGESVKEKIRKDLFEILPNPATFSLKNILISTSLMRLGIEAKVEIPENFDENGLNNSSFFLAGLLSSYENPFLHKLADNPLSHMYWICPAHTLAIVAENLAFQNKV